MGSSNSKPDDEKVIIKDENLDHSGRITNFGFVNLHSETVNHGIQMMSILTFLAMIIFLFWKCGPIIKSCLKRSPQQTQNQQHHMEMGMYRADPVLRIPPPDPFQLQKRKHDCQDCQASFQI